jgi:hypothetical protein
VRFRVFRASLQRSPVAPCRRRGCQPGDYPAPAFPVRPAPTGPDMRPCGFLDASRLHFFSFALQAPPGGSFVTGLLSRRRTGPAGWFSRPGRMWLASADAPGVRIPFAALIWSAGEGRVSTPRAHVPFGSLLRRGCFSSRLSRQAVATVLETRRAASGLWPRGQAVPCGPPAPL